jgi:hypothetical protein
MLKVYICLFLLLLECPFANSCLRIQCVCFPRIPMCVFSPYANVCVFPVCQCVCFPRMPMCVLSPYANVCVFPVCQCVCFPRMPMCVFSPYANVCVFPRRFSSYIPILLFLFGVRVRGVLLVFTWSVLVFQVLEPVRGALLIYDYTE